MQTESGIGSVRFWRHVIVGVVIGLILLFMLLFVIFFCRSGALKKSLLEQQAINDQLNAQIIGAGLETAPGIDSSSGSGFSSGTENDAEMLDYQLLFPEMTVENADKVDDSTEKVVYLTFDDGPSLTNTDQILKILDRYGVKATFFVSGQFGTKDFRASMFRKEQEAGHTVALHTFSHDYRKIYASIESYLKDLNQIYTEVYDATGVQPNLVRFPGGSLNRYNGTIYQQLASELLRRGFTYHDWTVSSEDAVKAGWTASEEIKTVKKAAEGRSKIVLLCHDTDAQKNTVEALPTLIEYFQEKGYEFRALDNTVRPFQFGYQY